MNKNFFDDFNIEYADVEIGKEYPIFGSITNIFEKTNEDTLIIELNKNIVAELQMEDEEKINILKERAFEAGIFICKINEICNEKVYVSCSAIIFGKKQNKELQ